MWYFLVRQTVPESSQYQKLQKKAILTEVELFNEPYENWYVFTVERESYVAFMDYLDREGIDYDLTSDRPTRQDLLLKMR
ncbi:hypothetical protein WBJ53_28215 [Spirosoma sp. SC4-14]|uniref:hypothetical protein n=1 Tax=Spirosoma sp. SC4-14 TaxID=3128900 RepID=UPI0030D458BD